MREKGYWWIKGRDLKRKAREKERRDGRKERRRDCKLRE